MRVESLIKTGFFFKISKSEIELQTPQCRKNNKGKFQLGFEQIITNNLTLTVALLISWHYSIKPCKDDPPIRFK